MCGRRADARGHCAQLCALLGFFLAWHIPPACPKTAISKEHCAAVHRQARAPALPALVRECIWSIRTVGARIRCSACPLQSLWGGLRDPHRR